MGEKMRHLLLTFVVFTSLCVNAYSADYWKKQSGPYGASITSIVMDEFTGDLFISTAGSGVFTKKYGSEKWTSLNDNLMKFNVMVNTVYINSNGDLIALTDSLGILKKNLSGSWQSINIGLGGHLSFSSFLKIKEDIFLVGSKGKAVFRSTNGGESWSNYNTGLLSDENINSLCLVKNIIFAGTDRGIFKSSDEGKKWLKVNEEISKINQIIFDVNSERIYAGTDRGVYYSKDFGINWRWANTGLLPETNVMSIEKFGDSLYIGTMDGGLKLCYYDSLLWKPAEELHSISFAQTIKTIGNSLYFGSNRSFFKFENDALVRVVEGLSISNINSFIEFDGILYSATDNGVYLSSNFGNTWEGINLGFEKDLKVTYLARLNTGEMFAGTNKGIYYFDRTSAIWVKFENPELNNEYITILAVDSTGTVYAGTASKGIWKTSENRWLQMNGGDIEKQEILSLIVVDSNYIYAGTGSNGLYRKAPFDEWRKVTGVEVGINSVSSLEYVLYERDEEISKGRIILAATNLGVLRSRDNGFVWSKSLGTLSSQVTSLISLNNDTVFAGLKNIPGIFRTLDNGDSWSGLYDQSGISKYKITNFFNSKSGFVYAGTIEGGCYRSLGSSKDLNPERPKLSIIGKKEFCEGEFCVLDAGEGFERYEWSNGSKVRFDTVWTKGNYWVKVWNEYGFSSVSDTIPIKVEQKPGKPNILYNGDVLYCPSFASKYVWFLDDKEIEGLQTNVYKPIVSGWYKCEVHSELDCSNISDAVRVELADVSDYDFSSNFNIYPNPVENSLSIDISKFVNADMMNFKVDISIKNLLGEEVFNKRYNNYFNDINMDLGNLSSGLYFLKISVNNNYYLAKFIKR